MITILMGKSGSGKNYIESKLVELGYERVVSTTSRPTRDGEKTSKSFARLEIIPIFAPS